MATPDTLPEGTPPLVLVTTASANHLLWNVTAMNIEDMSFEQLCQTFGYEPKRRPLSRREAAELLGLAVDTLEGYDYRGVGPRSFCPPGTRRVWYAERDLLLWLASGARFSTSSESVEVAL